MFRCNYCILLTRYYKRYRSTISKGCYSDGELGLEFELGLVGVMVSTSYDKGKGHNTLGMETFRIVDQNSTNVQNKLPASLSHTESKHLTLY